MELGGPDAVWVPQAHPTLLACLTSIDNQMRKEGCLSLRDPDFVRATLREFLITANGGPARTPAVLPARCRRYKEKRMSERDFLSALDARRPGLELLEPTWRMIDDVLAGRIKRRGANGWYSNYFPKGRLEAESEYSLRVELTPFFPQTPQLLASRLGALFRTRLQVDLASARGADPSRGLSPEEGRGERTTADDLKNRPTSRWEKFLSEAGRRHTSFEDFAVQAACLAQTHGFCAALMDRDPLPEDIAASTRRPGVSPGHNGENVTDGEVWAGRPYDVSQAEADARNLGRPFLALYAAPQILDWDFGSDGLLNWVKFGEQELWRPRWDSPSEMVRVYRIVDREFIHVYRVRRNAGGEWITQAETPVAHGFGGKVPVVFLHPFPAQDGIGRPILQRAAEADVASARVLSHLVWDLFLLGNPILTVKTSRNDDELTRIGLGATRYIPLRNGVPNQENPEELSFVQLDPTGIELLFRAHGLFASQAQKSSGGDEAALPREQSGVAQAWRFKTGEERVLFMLARALEPFLNKCLSLAQHALSIDGDAPVARLPETFDVTTPAETLETAEKVLQTAERFGQPELARTALQRIEATLGVLPQATREALERERTSLPGPLS